MKDKKNKVKEMKDKKIQAGAELCQAQLSQN